MDLDKIDDDSSLADLGVDLTYGFVLVRRIPKA
jgi:hypothetical protein